MSRASSAVARIGEDRAADELRVARAFVHDARYRIVGNLKRIDRNRDAEATAISNRAYEKLAYGFDLWE